jgi:two-component SAPR family response regulator
MMDSLLVHRLPDFLLIILSAWVGLGLLVRAPSDRVNRAFTWMCVLLVFYGISSIQAQLTTSQTVLQFLQREHLVATMLAPAAFLHFVVLLSTSGAVQPLYTWLVRFFYLLGISLACYAAFGPLPVSVPTAVAVSTAWDEPRFPQGVLKWVAVGQRVVPLLLAMGILAATWRVAVRGPDVQEQQKWRTLVVAGAIGVVGGIAATVARELSVSPAVPRLLMVSALVIFTYAALRYRLLLPSRLAQRSFLYTILGSLLTTLYIILAIALEWVSGEILQINVPIVTILSILGLAVAFGPVGEWLRSQIDRRFYPREFDYSRLLKSLSDELFERGGLNEQLQAGLSLICQTLDVSGGFVAVVEGDALTTRASYGHDETPAQLHDIPRPDELAIVQEPWQPWPLATALIPLRRGTDQVGLLVLGMRRSEYRSPMPFNATEQALLSHLSSYMALTIDHARTRDEHQSVMVTLNEQSQMLRQQKEQLSKKAAEAVQQVSTMSSPRTSLHVQALGTLQVRCNGELISRWGGSKAGTYQAEALFAFLFDRRGKGITKDEAEEIIWTDLEISRADSAFHRTLAGLRRTLEPGLRRGNLSKTILYHHDRYWLEMSIIEWCDIEEFVAAAERGLTQFYQQQYKDALASLERASELYRGDYMDDCPFFGDSTYVEDQRSMLRSRYVDAQLTLGAIYEMQGRIGEATSAYHRALTSSLDGCPLASDGLARLQGGLAG